MDFSASQLLTVRQFLTLHPRPSPVCSASLEKPNVTASIEEVRVFLNKYGSHGTRLCRDPRETGT